jgi:membrane associated rhomboid family serine protease
MTPTPVGMRCPECARDRTKVKTIGSLANTPVVTQALIAINVLVFLAETASGASLGGVSGTGGTVFSHLDLFGPAISIGHQYYRLITSGFLHDGIIHIAVNMLSLYFVGRALEPAVGRVNFVAIYFASLLAGSFGALLFQPDAPTVGASTAIFGIFGALIVLAHYRGISIWQSGLGAMLVINLVLSVSYAGISLGGHLGGLVGGLIAGWLVVQVGERRRMPAAVVAGCIALAALSVVGAIAVAGGHGLAPNGIGLGS